MKPNSPIKNTFGLTVLVLLVAAIAWLVPREQFPLLMGIYGVAFGIYFWLIRQDLPNRVIFWVGILVRVLVLFSIPQLSNDVYRFIWDGRLLVAGVDPFALRPSEWLALTNPPTGINQELHQLIYADNYTVYPPIHQAIFWLAARLSNSIWGSIMILKSVLVLGEIGLLWLLQKAKNSTIFPSNLFVIYALNPLVILEIAGNGHFEGLMVLFLVFGIYRLRKNDFGWASLGLGLAIATKLLPLMLFPLIYFYFPKGDWRHKLSNNRFIPVFGVGILINILLWLPFWWMGSLHHLMDSIWLYFESFEFNASIFYFLKWLAPNGWRIGLMTNGLTILVIGYLALWQKAGDFSQLISSMAWIWVIYLLNSAIVHPWYLIPILVLSTMRNSWVGVIWSFLIYLSYSHYWDGAMREHFWVIGFEYLLLTSWIVYELSKRQAIKTN